MEAMALVTMISINISCMVYVTSKVIGFMLKMMEYLQEEMKKD